MRHAAKVDANHREIVATLRGCGFAVFDTSGLPKFVDLVAYRVTHGTLLIEVKDGKKKPSAQKLTPAQRQLARDFPVTVLRSVADVLELVGQMDIPRQDLSNG